MTAPATAPLLERRGGLLESATELPALLAATRRAAQGKRQRPEVARFLMDAERECLRLQQSLRAPLGSPAAWRPGPACSFGIRDPKPRRITALPFVDRVVHHALCAVIEPRLERYAISDSYACRVDKGQHAALARAQRFVRACREGWAFRGDVTAYFASIPHGPLLELLTRRIGDPEIVERLERIVRAYPVASGRGLPIGALTSQHLANMYLGALDHYVKEELGVRHYLRYMDDFLAVGDREQMKELRGQVDAYLRERLLLELNPRTSSLLPLRDGVPLLGMRVYAAVIRMRPERWRRFRTKQRAMVEALAAGELEEEEAARRLGSQYGHIAQFNTYVRTNELARLAEASNGPGADERRLQACHAGRVVEQRRRQRAGSEPQQERAHEPRQQRGVSSCELSTQNKPAAHRRAGLVRGTEAPGPRTQVPAPRC